MARVKRACNDPTVLREIWLREKLEAEKRKKEQEEDTSDDQLVGIESLIELEAEESCAEEDEEACDAPKRTLKGTVSEHRAIHIERTAIQKERKIKNRSRKFRLYTCHPCNKKFPTPNQLRIHENSGPHRRHVSRQNNTFDCKVCDLTFSSAVDQAAHLGGRRHRSKLNRRNK